MSRFYHLTALKSLLHALLDTLAAVFSLKWLLVSHSLYEADLEDGTYSEKIDVYSGMS